MTRLFIYGTLKRGKHNSHIMQYADFVSDAWTDDNYTLHIAGLPFLVPGDGPAVRGELYDVDDHMLGYLDRFEGHPNFYKRSPITVYIEDGSSMKVETYIYQGSLKRTIIAEEF